MPFEIRKRGAKWCVVNTSTGESKGCSATRKLAVRHLRAIQVNTKD